MIFRVCECGNQLFEDAGMCAQCMAQKKYPPISTPLPQSRLLTPAEKRKQLDLKHAADIVALKEKVIAAVEDADDYEVEIRYVKDLSPIEGWLKDHGWKWRYKDCGYNEGGDSVGVAVVEPASPN